MICYLCFYSKKRSDNRKLKINNINRIIINSNISQIDLHKYNFSKLVLIKKKRLRLNKYIILVSN